MKMKYGRALMIFLSMVAASHTPLVIASQETKLSKAHVEMLHRLAEQAEDGSMSEISDDAEEIEASAEAAAAIAEIEASVVKLLVRTHDYDNDHPWNGPSQESQTGSGFVIKGNRIMTNAHVVANAAYVQVQRSDKPKKYFATVEHVGHECDLAIVVVKDPSFFEGLNALEFGGLASKRERVETIGFPAGGDSVSITEGTISRIEMSPYAHTSTTLLSVQTDAAINPGNSGGPVVGEDGRVVGVAFQGADELQNTGYMIPTPVIEHFLTDIAKGKYRGFPELGVDFQELENESLRRHYNIDDSRSGMLVTHIQAGSTAKGKLKVGDIVMAIDGIKIENDKQYSYDGKIRLDFLHIIRNKQIDDTLSMDVLRKGNPLTVTVKLSRSSGDFDVIPSITFDKKPSYYIYGGCVFQPLTAEVLASGITMELLFTLDKEKHNIDQEHVVLTKVLPEDVNEGYHDFQTKVLMTVNGKKPTNIKHLIQLIKENTGEYQEFVFSDNDRLILDREKADASLADLLSNHSIGCDRSLDLLD